MDSPDIRIVLVAPSHPGNIGAVARAMKNMALTRAGAGAAAALPGCRGDRPCLGRRRCARRRTRAWRRLAEALHGCGFVAATTSRERDQYFRIVDVREAAARIVAEAQRAPAAVVFGAERTGLTNEELETAHALIRIPANDGLPVAQPGDGGAAGRLRAVPRAARQPVIASSPGAAPLASARGHGAALTCTSSRCSRRSISATARRSGTHLMSRIRRFLQRAELDQNEVNILRGFLTAVQNRRRPAGPRP